MAIQRVAKSNLTNAKIAELLGLTLNGDVMSKEGTTTSGFNWSGMSLYLTNSGNSKGVWGFTDGATHLAFEKTENSCIFGVKTASSEFLNFGYTLATNLLTGEQRWVYFVVCGNEGYMSIANSSTFHTIKTSLSFTDDNIVSMVNYYIPEFGLICNDVFSLVTYKTREDYLYNRFNLNGNYYIKPSANDKEVTSPTSRYDVIAVRVR